MKFREHRGSLDDAMKTCVEIPDGPALLAHCRKLFESWPGVPLINPKSLVVEPYHMMRDERIGWPMTYIVWLKGYGVLGFTDGPIP